jgi:predicted dehydrogenase
VSEAGGGERGAVSAAGGGERGETEAAGPVGIAVIGTGYGARVALPCYLRLAEFEPLAVWSRRAERAREVAAQAGLAVGSDRLEEVLDVDGLEAVHVATPVADHLSVVRAAAARGLHVLCEKPLAMDLAQALAIREAIQAAGVLCAVNLSRRFQQARARLLEVAEEVLGRPRLAHISLVHDDHATAGSRAVSWVHDAALGGGRLQAYGVHDLDLALAALGPIAAVAASLQVQIPERERDGRPVAVSAEDAYGILLEPQRGGLACIWLAATARHRRGDLVELYGEDGSVRLDEQRRLWWGRAGEELRCEGPLGADSASAFEQVALGFAAAIRHGAPVHPSLAHGLALQALMDAVREAARERRWVAVARVPPARRQPAAAPATPTSCSSRSMQRFA